MPTVDLSHPIAPGMPVYPGDPQVERRQVASASADGYNLAAWRFGGHIGTHLDAPRHFLDDGADLAALDVAPFCGPARLWRLPLPADGVLAYDAVAERLPELQPGDRLILDFDWSRHWQTDIYYMRHPVLSREAATAIAAREPALLGLDTPSPCRGEPELHPIFLTRGIALLENLRGLDELPDEWELLCLPLRLVGGDGSPVRALARW